MPYKLTFEDGSDGYLEHYGTKGMHWGVWNAETRLRYQNEGNTSGGGGGGSDDEQEIMDDEYGITGMSRDAARKKVIEDHKKTERERLAIQSKKGNFGGSASSRLRSRESLMVGLSAANKHPKDARSYGGKKNWSYIKTDIKSTVKIVSNGKKAVYKAFKRAQ